MEGKTNFSRRLG